MNLGIDGQLKTSDFHLYRPYHSGKSRNLLGGTTSTPFFPIPIKHANPSYSNSSEPNTSGIDRYFPLPGTHRDSWGQWVLFTSLQIDSKSLKETST